MVSLEDNKALYEISSPGEVRDILFDMNSDVSPFPDGLEVISTKLTIILWGWMLL